MIRNAERLRLLFVCLGNICRSPTAEGAMRRLVAAAGHAAHITLDSAGTGNWHVGELPDPRTVAAAARRGLVLEHRARQLVAADFARFDLVIAMDRANRSNALRLAPAGRDVPLLRSFDPSALPGAEVPDPYAGGALGFEQVLDICERACAGLLAHVLRTAPWMRPPT